MSPALSSFAASGPSGPGQPGRDRSGPARPDRSPSAPITTGKRVASESEAIRLSRPGGHLHRGGPAQISRLAGTAGHRLDATGAQRPLGDVAEGDCGAAVVPIESSVEGGVPATIDALTEHGRLQIIAEVLVPVRFVLAVKPGTSREQVTSFGSHPHGEAQVRTFMSENF